MVDGDAAELDLPRAQIKRCVLAKIAGGTDDKRFSVSKDALLAFSEAAKVFVSLVSTTANDVCKESKRQTISAEDVLKAVEELEFGEILPELTEFLEGKRRAWFEWCLNPFEWVACILSTAVALGAAVTRMSFVRDSSVQ